MSIPTSDQANKLTLQATERLISQELNSLKDLISRTINQGNYSCTAKLNYPNSLELLRNLGYEVTAEGYSTYIIKWSRILP